MSVASFYEHKYGLPLKRPEAPCVRVCNGTNACIPIELFVIVYGQKYTAELEWDQHAKFLNVPSTKPKELASNLEDLINKVDSTNNPICKTFKIGVEKKLVEVPARILPPPTILYGGDVKVKPKHGISNVSTWFLRMSRTGLV